MKLRINTKLRAALIAAITAVGFTLPQTYGTVSWNGGAIGGDWFYTDSGKTGSVLTDDEHGQVNITAEGSNPVTAGISEVTVKDGATVRISGGNFWGQDRTFAALTIDDITAGDGTGSLLLSTQPYTAGKAPANTTATVKAVTGTLSGVQNYGVLTLGEDGTSSFGLTGAIVNNAGTVTLNGTYSFDTSNANNYALKQEGSATWTDPTNEQGFKKTSGSSYYIIKGATVGTGFQATTTTGATVSEESAGTYYFTAGDVTDTTKFYVKTDAVTLEGVTGTGVFQVDHAGATVTVQDATYRVTSGNMNVNIVINDKGVLETTHSGVNGFITGALTINAGGIMRIVGEHDAFGWGSKNQCVASLTMKGEEGKLARLELNQSTGNSATMVTDINMLGYSTITSTKEGGSKGFNTFGCNITASGVQNNIDVLDVRRNGVTIDVEEEGELTIGKLTINGSDHSASSVVVKQGEGALHFTGETKAEGLNIQAGTVDISGTGELHALTIGTDGSLSITGGSTTVTGTSNAIGNTIDLQAGSLSLAGTYDLSDLEVDGGTKYEGGPGIAEGSGFANTAGTLDVVDITSGTLTLTGATFNYRGSQVQVDAATGDATLSGGTNYSTLYVNNDGEVSFAAAQTIAGQHEASVSNVVLNATGTTITMDAEASVALSMASAAESATVLATEDITLTSVAGPATGKTLTFSADGHTISLQGDDSYTGNVVVDKGTVKFTGGDKKKALGAFNGGNTVPNPDKTITVNEGGTVDLNGAADLTYVFTLNGGSLVNTGAAIGDGSMQTTGIKLTDDSTVGGTGNFYLLGPGYSATSLDLAGHTLVKTGENLFGLRNTTVTSGTIEVQQGTVHFFNDTSMSGDIVLAGGNVTGTIKLADDITIGSTAEGGATFSAALTPGDHGITFNTTTDLTVNSSLTGTFTKTGEGALILAGDGNYISDAIDLQAGTIVLAGGFDVSAIDHEEGEIAYFENPDGPATVNGFAKYTGEVQLVSSNFANVSVGDEGVILLDGYSVDYDATTGKAGGTISLGAFYVNEGEANVSTIHEASATAAVMLADGAKLVVDDDLSSGVYSTGDDKGFVEIKDGKTLGYSPLADVELSGEGTYDLGSMYDLGSVALADDWTGTVKVSNNGNATNLNIAALGRAGSTVELDSVTGWLSNDGLVINAAVQLSGDGLTVNNGSSNKTIEFAGGVKGEGDFVYTMANGANNQTYVFSGDVSDWSGDFKASGDGKTSTLKFYGDATEVGADIELNAGTLNLVVGNGTDEFSTVFHGEVTASSITVSELAAATFENVNLLAAVVNHGEVSISYATLGDAFSQQGGGIAHYGLDGEITQGDNFYIGESEAFVQVVNGGTSAGSVTWQDQSYDLETDGRIIVREGDVDYSTFYVNDGTVKISDIANSGHDTTTVEVASGTLDVDQAGSGIEISVTGMATVTGEGLDASEVGIASESIANFGETMELDGVKFSSDSIGVAVYNKGDDDAYSLDNTDMVVSAQSITKTTDGDVTVSNWLTVEEITNVEGGTLTLNGQEDAVEVANITVGPDSTVEILDNQTSEEITVTVTEELAAGGGTLLANLVMADDSALLVGGVEQALHVGSTLAMGANIALDALTLKALDNLAVGGEFWLIDAAEGRELVYEGPTGEDAWYDSVFSRVAADSDYELKGDFNIVFDDELDAFGLKKFSNVPEPTTGTLSLLALAALAARRRRH
ncbi:MAG: hypothetical protein MJ058_01965 [Akkermansia sp.]|nr:hypothetical protein [Akkermansia sp.]